MSYQVYRNGKAEHEFESPKELREYLIKIGVIRPVSFWDKTEYTGVYRCSNCQRLVSVEDIYDYDYCPHCGRNMDIGWDE